MTEQQYFDQFIGDDDRVQEDKPVATPMYFAVGDGGSEIATYRATVLSFAPIWYAGKWYTKEEAYLAARRENGEING